MRRMEGRNDERRCDMRKGIVKHEAWRENESMGEQTRYIRNKRFMTPAMSGVPPDLTVGDKT